MNPLSRCLFLQQPNSSHIGLVTYQICELEHYGLSLISSNSNNSPLLGPQLFYGWRGENISSSLQSFIQDPCQNSVHELEIIQMEFFLDINNTPVSLTVSSP